MCKIFAVAVWLFGAASLFPSLGWAQGPGDDPSPCDAPTAATPPAPSDFSLTYVFGPVQADRGPTTIFTLAGPVEAEWTTSRLDLATRQRVKTTQLKPLRDGARDRVYSAVVACRFFDLAPSYWNANVMDGAVQSLSVVAGGRTHRVIIHYVAVKRVQEIVAAALREAE